MRSKAPAWAIVRADDPELIEKMDRLSIKAIFDSEADAQDEHNRLKDAASPSGSYMLVRTRRVTAEECNPPVEQNRIHGLAHARHFVNELPDGAAFRQA